MLTASGLCSGFLGLHLVYHKSDKCSENLGSLDQGGGCSSDATLTFSLYLHNPPSLFQAKSIFSVFWALNSAQKVFKDEEYLPSLKGDQQCIGESTMLRVRRVKLSSRKATNQLCDLGRST